MLLLHDLLKKAVDLEASDLHIKPGAVPVFRIDGNLTALEQSSALTRDEVAAIAEHILSRHGIAKKSLGEIDIGYSEEGVGRFRCNLFSQQGSIGAVFRVLSPEPMAIRDLHLPVVLEQVALEERGLVLVTGVTGSGKSTSLAAMIDHINQHRSRHIITIEDPIEFVHEDNRCLITQRQLGLDTAGFAPALRASLRQDPDVILIGEMRDRETIDAALLAAETGHLVFSTLHTLDAGETINRILSAYPAEQQDQVRLQLSEVLRAVISMRLIARAGQSGLVPAVEVLVATRFVSECVRDATRTHRIRDAMAEGFEQYGMQTFDQSLLDLYTQQLITADTALAAASNPSDLDLRMRGIISGVEAGRAERGPAGLIES